MTSSRILMLIGLALHTVVSLFLLSSCRPESHSSPEAARRQLTEKNIEFSVERCVKSIRDGDVEAVKLFLDAGMSPESADGSGSPVLLNAAIKNDSSIAQLLVDHGANVNSRTKDGESPLMVAALMGATDTVKVLIKAGADLNARDNRGETPVAHAQSHNHTEVVELLKAAGAVQ